MSTAGLVAMRSSCPRNPSGAQNAGNNNNNNSNNTKRKDSKDGGAGYNGEEVTKPGPHDVLLGRGGGTNNHSGNINFRKLVNEHKMRYLACSKIEKPNVAREVVDLWKKLEPRGRFLTRKEDTKGKTNANGDEIVVWVEVPEKKAREKASQCLRERTPDVVPYIRHLREQQDQMTEQGVSMVQQQLRMQREAQMQENSLHGMAAYGRSNTIAECGRYQGGSMNPMAAMSNGDFNNRRGSMPNMMQGPGNGMGMNPMQQQQSQAFNRRISSPHLSGNNGMPNNAAAMMGGMNPQMNPQFGNGGGGAGGMMEPGFCGSDGGMYDPAYASSMTAMQLQQHHQQQLQLQQLQQQQQMLQHQMAMQQQHMAAVNMQAQMNMNMNNMGMSGMRNSSGMMGGGGGGQMDPPQQWNMQQQEPMNMPSGVSPGGMQDQMGHHGGMPRQSGHGGMPRQSGHGGMPSQSGHGGMPSQSGHGGMPNHSSHGGIPDHSGHGGIPNQSGHGGMPSHSGHGGMPNHSGHGGMPNQSGHGSSHRSQSARGSNKKDSSSHRRNSRGRVPDAPPRSTDLEPIPLPKPEKNSSADIPSRPTRDISPARRDPLEHSASSHNNLSNSRHMKQPPKAAVKPIDKTPQAPTRSNHHPSSMAAPIDPPAAGAGDDDIPLPLNVPGGDDEVGIDEYRRTLASYMHSQNIQTQAPVFDSDEEEDLSVESFPEWPEEGETKKRIGRAAPDVRRVDRHKSGHSMMSCTTNKSNATSLSGLSMLSDMMSMESGKSLGTGKSSREEKMGASKRFSSNASIMSELTDISHTIDGLGLDDDI